MTPLRDAINRCHEVFAKSGEIPWTTEFCRAKRARPEIDNVFMELGGMFTQLVSMHPEICARFLGQAIEAFNADHVVWGTDSIWQGSRQRQIESLRRFQIPERLVGQYRYRPFTPELTARIFSANAARLFRLDLEAKAQRYAERLPEPRAARVPGWEPSASNRFYGWVKGLA